MYKTVDTNILTGEVTVKEWSDEEVLARRARMEPYAWDGLRVQRNALLVDSDNYVRPDRWDGYTAEQKAAWTSYRQALRDLPQNTTDPFNPVWPVKPT